MSYLKYWSLSRMPFAHKAEEYFFIGTPQRDFFAGLNELIGNPTGAAVLVGPRGCGGTCLLKHTARTSGLGNSAVEVLWCGGGTAGDNVVVRALARSLGLWEHSLGAVTAAIRGNQRRGIKTLWLADRAGPATARVAGRLLCELSALTVIMHSGAGAYGSLSEILAQHGRAPTVVKMGLRPLSQDDTFAYVRRSLHMAGGNADCWTESAIVRLHEFTRGRLARLSVVAESAMALAAAGHFKRVSPGLVEQVGRSQNLAA
ncbi:MAG: hypothetical protein MI861_01780 [Pirellulales bacterium]|nr:hypothetical protein [Pirellulales bacterium]